MLSPQDKYKTKQYYVYVKCRPDGKPFYVGKGHAGRADATKRNPHHDNVVKKYGKENILIYKLNCQSEKQAFEYEIWMIAWCKTQGHRLTNMTDGGEGSSGCKQNQEFCMAKSKLMRRLNAAGITGTKEEQSERLRKLNATGAMGTKKERSERTHKAWTPKRHASAKASWTPKRHAMHVKATRRMHAEGTIWTSENRAKQSKRITELNLNTFWITNGKSNKKLNRGCAIQLGWRAGRAI